MVKISIKWGKEKFDGLDLDEASDVKAFKALVYSLTNVPVDKQKLLFKGSVIKDDANWAALKVPEGATLMLMGTAEDKALKPPEAKTIFIEDLNPEERAKILKEKTGEVLPCGLVNLGNTCYMNSSLQCLKRINEFKDSMIKFKGNRNTEDPTIHANLALRELFHKLDTAGDSVQPLAFFTFLSTINPMFAELAEKGGSYRQQDADECFNCILDFVGQHVQYEDQEGTKHNMIDYLFKIEFEVTWKNLENPDEPSEVKYESQRKLPCIIDNEGNPINHLHEGVKVALSEVVNKNSPTLGRPCDYMKTLNIAKLPPYLIVQNIRFMWKKAVENTGSKATKAKILRNVSFPRVLDIYNFCSEKLQKQLDTGRAYEKKKNEEKVQHDKDKFEEYKVAQEKSGKIVAEDSRETFKRFKESTTEAEIQEHEDQLYRKIGTGLETGNYELIAVLTHKGRTSDSGHYVGWVHKRGDDWLKYDDDVVSVVKTEEIMNLRGGGDWHMAYYCIYRRIEIQ